MGAPVTVQSLQSDIQKLQSQVAALSTTAKNSTAPVNPSARDKTNQSNVSSTQIMDVLWNTVYYYFTDFPTIYDPFTTLSNPQYANFNLVIVDSSNPGGIGIVNGAVHIFTNSPSVASDSVQIYKVTPISPTYSFSKASRFRTQVTFDSATAQNIYIVLGDFNGDSYGFYISNATLFGVATKGGVVTTTSLNITINNTALFKLDARFLPNTSVAFYVNDTLTGSITSGLPQTAGQIFWNFYAKSTSTIQSGIYAYFAEYIQMR